MDISSQGDWIVRTLGPMGVNCEIPHLLESDVGPIYNLLLQIMLKKFQFVR